MKLKYIYVITNSENGKKYVGSTERPIWRFREHMKALKHQRHKVQDMQDDYNKYGEDAFSYVIVGYQKKPFCNDDEYKMMVKLKTYDRRFGYNYNDRAMRKVRRMPGGSL